MKILLLQDHLRSGGAARAAGRWACLLKKAGHNVSQVAGDETGALGFLLSGKPPRGWGRIREFFTGGTGRKAAVEIHFGEILQETKPDLVWFHNLAGGVKWGWSEEMIRLAREHAAVLWTLHDMWALGDSSESYWKEESVVESARWKGAGDRKVEGWKSLGIEKRKCSRVARLCGAEGKNPVRLTAPSKWLAELTEKMTCLPCAHLANPIDLDLFSPGDPLEARRQLGLPEKGVVVLAGADSLQDPRKGFDLLQKAWKQIGLKDSTLALFGRHGATRPGEVYLGNLVTDEQMVAAYRAADLYVHPARMENAPCTIQESLACGTPVLTFAVGGIPEMLDPKKIGFLVPDTDSESLRNGLDSALGNPERLRKMRKEARTWAEDVWKPDFLAQGFQKVVGKQ